MPWQKLVNIMFYVSLFCKSWIIFPLFFLLMYLKILQPINCVGGFSNVINFFTLKRFKIVHIFFGCLLGVRSNVWLWFLLVIKNIAYFVLRNLNNKVKNFLIHRIRLFLFEKCKNIVFNLQFVYIWHFEWRINLEEEKDISYFEQ